VNATCRTTVSALIVLGTFVAAASSQEPVPRGPSRTDILEQKVKMLEGALAQQEERTRELEQQVADLKAAVARLTEACKQAGIDPEESKSRSKLDSMVVSCDLRMVRVSDGATVSQATGQGSYARLGRVAAALADKFKEDTPLKGESVAVIVPRNRSGSTDGATIVNELSDKVNGALVETHWFDVRERVDLSSILNEKDLELADIVKNPKVMEKLGNVKYVILGGATVASQGERK
jgi:hypothetical protein